MQNVFEKIIEQLEDAKSNVPVNRLLDDIINDKPKELGQLMAYNKAIEIVKQEAEEYNNGWIPCSDRLPNGIMKNVLCQFYDERIGTISVEHLIYEVKNNSGYCIAWQPLPEPFEE